MAGYALTTWFGKRRTPLAMAQPGPSQAPPHTPDFIEYSIAIAHKMGLDCILTRVQSLSALTEFMDRHIRGHQELTKWRLHCQGFYLVE